MHDFPMYASFHISIVIIFFGYQSPVEDLYMSNLVNYLQMKQGRLRGPIITIIDSHMFKQKLRLAAACYLKRHAIAPGDPVII
jgi:hypothetical protein